MDPATLTAAVGVAVKLSELAKSLREILEKVSGFDVEMKVFRYLQVAQTCLDELGRERQRILKEAAGCDLRQPSQVAALLERMREYLIEDNLRGTLKKAMAGLEACRGEIERAAQGLKWRKGDKEQAVQDFLNTLADLGAQAQSLEYTFFPEYSGCGLETLAPVYQLLTRIEENLHEGREFDAGAEKKEFSLLIQAALRDPAQREWIDKVAEIEKPIVKLQSAFNIKV